MSAERRKWLIPVSSVACAVGIITGVSAIDHKYYQGKGSSWLLDQLHPTPEPTSTSLPTETPQPTQSPLPYSTYTRSYKFIIHYTDTTYAESVELFTNKRPNLVGKNGIIKLAAADVFCPPNQGSPTFSGAPDPVIRASGCVQEFSPDLQIATRNTITYQTQYPRK